LRFWPKPAMYTGPSAGFGVMSVSAKPARSDSAAGDSPPRQHQHNERRKSGTGLSLTMRYSLIEPASLLAVTPAASKLAG
jgi:hypothetical protein